MALGAALKAALASFAGREVSTPTTLHLHTLRTTEKLNHCEANSLPTRGESSNRVLISEPSRAAQFLRSRLSYEQRTSCATTCR